MNTITTAQAAEFLQAHDNYLILTHVRPDGDTIGCAGPCARRGRLPIFWKIQRLQSCLRTI